MKPNRLTYGLPNQLGFNILWGAKIHLLKFSLFLEKYLVANRYSLLYTDTDCLCIALAGSYIDECVKPELMSEYLTEKFTFLVNPNNPADKREGGKWKEEVSNAKIFIGLSSKLYFMQGENFVKLGSRGYQKDKNLDSLRYRDYMNALTDPFKVCSDLIDERHLLEEMEEDREDNEKTLSNRGFIVKNNEMVTYKVDKTKMNSLYMKLIVKPCLCCTKPYENL